MELRLIGQESPEYRELVQLRIRALLAPIGIPASYIDPEREKDDLFIGAFEGDRIAGCCVLTRRDAETVQLRQMVVDPDRQRSGIGARILAFAEQTARGQGYRRLMMHARNPAIPFYEKCGYSIEGGEFFEVNVGHHRMVKPLHP